MNLANSPAIVVIDANVLIAICARESALYPLALAEVNRYIAQNCLLYVPGAAVAEVLYILCKKLETGLLTLPEHRQAVQSFLAYSRMLLPPPVGDMALAARAEQLRGRTTCRNAADGLYIALAEELAKVDHTEIVTFDLRLQKKAVREAPSVNINLLTI